MCTEAGENYEAAKTRWKTELIQAGKKEEKRQQRQERIFARQSSQAVYQEPVAAGTQVWKNKWKAWVLCLFLGFLGAHKFYEGKIGEGILYLFTMGLWGIGWIADAVILLFKPNPYMVVKKK